MCTVALTSRPATPPHLKLVTNRTHSDTPKAANQTNEQTNKRTNNQTNNKTNIINNNNNELQAHDSSPSSASPSSVLASYWHWHCIGIIPSPHRQTDGPTQSVTTIEDLLSRNSS
ncbi:hypothetical protein KC19_10G157300 [Ceratodon purpureus]|uniref:Uncharacterized protein n=1 Tax=Ceratodon purpureus TaxID=3225 RepID=A0A8T0GMB1_CERPU|nr:hypothetical protein KC19_10G157300 [Ceratodon purpureus]